MADPDEINEPIEEGIVIRDCCGLLRGRRRGQAHRSQDLEGPLHLRPEQALCPHLRRRAGDHSRLRHRCRGHRQFADTYLANEESKHKNELERLYYAVVHSGGVGGYLGTNPGDIRTLLAAFFLIGDLH